MNTMTPSAGRTRKALAMATPSKNVCSNRPTRADVPATRLTACVSSPKWKWGVSVCCVRCTARYPASTSPGAAAPERANASGSTSTSATASMKPAPNATKCSMTARPRAARRVTASAPSTLPSAATSAYTKALDTGQQVLLGVALRILEHLGEQPLQHFAHVRPGPHPRGDQVVPVHRELRQRQRILRGADRCDDGREAGNGKRETGNVQRGQYREQVVGVFPGLRKPAPDRRKVLRVRIFVLPRADRAPSLDVLIGALEPREQGRRIRSDNCRDEHGIARQLIHVSRFPFPVFRLPDLRQPNPRRPCVDPQREEFRDAGGRRDPLEPLVAHPLRRQLRQALRVRFRGLERARVDPELEAGAEAQGAQDP